MTKIYSYVLPYDFGVAPNPYWGLCTLTICKPDIRRTADVGDWVIGTGSKNAEVGQGKTVDLSSYLIYAMKISDIKSFQEYDEFCKISLSNKIADSTSQDWKIQMGDCIYDYANYSQTPTMRGNYHHDEDRKRDMNGDNSLLSDHFYYFGSEPKLIRDDLKEIIHRNRKHSRIVRESLVKSFEEWINSNFEKNKIYAEPLLHWKYLKQTEKDVSAFCAECAKQQMVDDKYDTEEIVT